MLHPTRNIKSWAEDDRPREKMWMKGEAALSDAELLAIILGSGSRNQSAVELAKAMLLNANHRLDQLARLSARELMTYKGIGQAKAVSVKAALELGRRRQLVQADRKDPVGSSEDAYRLIAPFLQDKRTEEFWIMLFDRRNQLVSRKRISSGGVSATIVDAKVIFKEALEVLASGIILAHNHPSGNRKPGESDISLTRKIREACKLLDIDLLDHLVVTDHDYFSFRDEGLL